MTTTDNKADPRKYGIQAATFSEAIHVGRVNKAGTAFLHKEEATDMTLFAVAEYTQKNFEGGLRVDFPAAGFVLEVKVMPIDKADDAS